MTPALRYRNTGLRHRNGTWLERSTPWLTWSRVHPIADKVGEFVAGAAIGAVNCRCRAENGRTVMALDDAIAEVESAGFTVVRPRDDPDTQLRHYWESALHALRIAQDFIHAGAKLHLSTSFDLADETIVNLIRAGVARQFNAVLDTAVVVRDQPEAPRHAAE